MNPSTAADRRALLKALAAAGLAGCGLPILAQQPAFPAKPVRIVVPYPAGGSGDIYCRPIAQALTTRFGQQVLIENRAGANGQIGTALVAKAPADGYTVLFVTDAAMSIAPAMTKLPYDARNDFQTLALIGFLPMLLVASEQSGIASIGDLVAQARAKPGGVSYGSLGIGSIAHVAMEVFAAGTGTELLHIPYQGTAPAMTAIVAGEVNTALLSIGAALQQIKAGRAKPIALAAPARSSVLPNVPTFAEAGIADFNVRAWFGFFVPRGTPDPVLQYLRREFWAVLSSKEYVSDVVVRNGAEPPNVTPEGMEAFIREDQSRWGEWVKRVEKRLGKTS